MASTILNFIIEKFLSNFLEINPSQTNISLLSGEFIFKNIRIKQKLLEYINIDYLEIITSYIGSIKILLSLPNFYSNTVKIYINDLFIYAKQKRIDNIQEKERIDQLISNKLYKLSLDENLLQQIDAINDTSDNFLSQIIRNINFFIKNIVFRFEDDISNPNIPFSVGLIIKSLNIASLNELYENNIIFNEDYNNITNLARDNKKRIFAFDNINIPDNPYEISEKKIIVEKLYFYIDTFNNKGELNFLKFINGKEKIKTLENLGSYIKEIQNFYYFCKSELNVNCDKKNIHQFIFYNLNVDINLTMNFNLENNNPKFKFTINDIKNFEVFIKIKQISLLFILLSYYNLYNYYLIGLKKTIFYLNLNQSEKYTYIYEYIDYYYNKYVLKNTNFAASNYIKEKEEKMTYEDIRDLRKIATNNIKLFEKIKEKEKKLKDLNSKWFFFSKNEEEIKSLKNEVEILKNLLKEKIINKISKNKNITQIGYKERFDNLDIDEEKISENDPYKYLPDNFLLYLFQVKISCFHIVIYNDNSQTKKSDLLIGNNKKLIDLSIKELFIKISLGIKSFNFILEILDMTARQEIINSNDYDIILLTQENNSENSNKKKLLLLEFESKQDENYTYKIILKNERKIIFVFNLLELSYIQNEILTALYSSILFMDLNQYAKEEINKYLKFGYIISEKNKKDKEDNNNSNIKKYSNYFCDIEILSPMVIMPQNILDIYNNKCIIINLGDISIKSNLVDSSLRKYMLSSSFNENNNNDNYIFLKKQKSNISLESNNSEDLYDNYILVLKGFNIIFSDECLKKDKYNSINSAFVINKIDISLLYQTLIIPSDLKLNNTNLTISVNIIELDLDEFQILLLIVFFKQIRIQNDILCKIKITQNEINKKDKKIIEIFKEHLIEKDILTEDEFREKRLDKKNIYNYSYKNENDFLTKKNEYSYNIKINKIIFKIYKVFPDLKNNIFLESHFYYFNFLMCGNSANDSLMKIGIKKLKLIDKEIDINKKYINLKEYQTLIDIKHKDNNNEMFSYIYIHIEQFKENQSEININNTNLILSFDVLTRIYSFLIYYYNIFYENYLNVNNKKKQNTKEGKNKSQKLYNKFVNLVVINKELNKVSNINEIIKNRYVFRIKLNDNFILIPFEISSLTAPILSLKLNMVYDQSSIREIEKQYNKKNKLVSVKENQIKSNMNLMIFKSEIDLIKYDIKKKKFLYRKKTYKILNNYRIQYTNNYLYLPIKKQSSSKIDISIEPIIINLSLDQFKELLLFYNKLMKFLYENLYEIYIPYVKPENVVFLEGKKYIKKDKITFKRLLWRIYIMYKIRKTFDKIKEGQKKNLTTINSLININLNMDRATITIFNNELNRKRLLLELQLSKLYLKSNNCTKPKSKINTANELLYIIAGIKIPFEQYIVHQLYKYMDISFNFKLNYYNLEYSSFEPIIDPIPFMFLSYQVDPIFKHNTLIKSYEIINLNISPAFIKVLNLLLSKFYAKSEKELKYQKNIISSKELSYSLFKKEDETVLRIINKTGLPIKFWFDFKNREKYILKDDGYITFSNSSLYETRRQQIQLIQKHPEKNTLSFQILGFEIIQNININKNNILYFKTNIKENKYLLYHIIVDTSGLINEIKFFPSIFFINKTKFDELLIYIDDKRINNNYIILKKDKKCSIPLSWMLSKQKILFKIDNNSTENILYNNITDCIFFEKFNDEELEKINKEKIDIKEELKYNFNIKKVNLQHPKYNEYISSMIINKFNKTNIPENIKRTTIIDKTDKNKSFSFGLNYIALSNKEHNNKLNDGIYKKLENTEKSYEFNVIIKPILYLYNYIPFNILISPNIHKNKKEDTKIIVRPLEKKEIYDLNWITNNDALISLSLNYYNNIFKSNKFPILRNKMEGIEKVLLHDKKSNKIVFDILIKLVKEEEENCNRIVEQFSLSTIDYIFFSEYLINNRMEFDIFSKPHLSEKDIDKLKSRKISLLSNDKYIDNLYINSIRTFDEKNQFFLKTIGINKNMEIIKHNSKYNISCSIVNSDNYIYSNIIIFEPKYILVNKLDFDIFYTQLTSDKRKKIKKIKKNERIILSSNINDDKNVFKLAIRFNNKFLFSGPFDITESKELDYRIKINRELYIKNRKHCYNIGNNYYLLFRIKFKEHQNTTYIFILFTKFPLLEIKNRTSHKLKIYEDENSIPTIVEPRVDIPFIWEDSTKIKETLKCSITNKEIHFSFSMFEGVPIPLTEDIYIFYNIKRNKSGSLIFLLEERKLKKDISDIIMNKQEKSLKIITLDLKGIGLSFIDDTPKEIFYMSFYEMKITKKDTFLYKNFKNIENISLKLKNFQIDYCLNDSIKSLIHPKIQQIPFLEEKDVININSDFIVISVNRTSYYNSENLIQYMNYDEINLSIKEVKLIINQIILEQLINLVREYTSLLDYNEKIRRNNKENIREDNLITNNNKSFEILTKENIDCNKTLINKLIISPIKIYITFRFDLSNIEIKFLPNFLSTILISLGNNLIKISESPLNFKIIEITNIYMDMSLILYKLIESYKREAIFQIYIILGSSDLIGNPVNLIEKIGNGLYEFVNEPIKGLKQNPSQFGKGVAKGVGGLINGVVGGTMDSVSKISGSLYSTIHGILGKKRGKMIDEIDDEPENILIGAENGIKGGYNEIKEGVTGLFVYPYKGGKTSGFNGFIKGLGTGLFGLVVSPLTSVLKITDSLAIGTKNTFGLLFNRILKNERFRFPRYIEYAKPLQKYDEDLSAATEYLTKLMNIDKPVISYFSPFICKNPGCTKKESFLIVTNDIFLVISNQNEVLLNIKIKEVENVEFNYENENFKIIFFIKYRKKIMLMMDKLNAVVTCNIYNLFKEEMKYFISEE